MAKVKNTRIYDLTYARMRIFGTQRRAAATARIPVSVWGAIESGKHIPTEDEAVKMCNALHLDVNTIFPYLRLKVRSHISSTNFSVMAKMRDEMGYTQEDFGRIIGGYSGREISCVEMGKATKHADDIISRAAIFFGIPTDRLRKNVDNSMIIVQEAVKRSRKANTKEVVKVVEEHTVEVISEVKEEPTTVESLVAKARRKLKNAGTTQVM